MHLGQIVLYYSPGNNVQPLAAVIAKVHDDDRVNLGIFNQFGNPVPNPPTRIPVGKCDDPRGYCTTSLPLHSEEVESQEMVSVDPALVPGINSNLQAVTAEAAIAEAKAAGVTPASPEAVAKAKAQMKKSAKS